MPEEIPVPVIFEDEHLLVVDKPAGLVVHPGAGNPSGTLVNALLGKGIEGGDDPLRPGVVHRLDRDTSGLMVLAKGEPAYSRLVGMLSARRVGRVYRALVGGEGLPGTGTIDSPVGRDPDNPTLMAAGVGKPAVTHFEVLPQRRGIRCCASGWRRGGRTRSGSTSRPSDTRSTPILFTAMPSPAIVSGYTPNGSPSNTLSLARP